MTLTDMIKKSLEEIEGWDYLDERSKAILICFASVDLAYVTFKWICEHKEEIISWLD